MELQKLATTNQLDSELQALRNMLELSNRPPSYELGSGVVGDCIQIEALA